MKRILIADPDQNVTFTLEKLLQAEEHDVTTCNDAFVLLQLTGMHSFDCILVNSLMETGDGRDMIPSLQVRQSGAAFLVIHESFVTEKVALPRVFDQVRKPLDYLETVKRIRQLFEGGGFSGVITGINLADYIQMFSLNKITKAIMVRKDAQRGIILIHDGRVIYAGTEKLKGEAAFQEILSWKQGQIKEVKVKKFPVPNIHKDVQELLLNAAMLVDESMIGPDTEVNLPGREGVAALHGEEKTISAFAEAMPQEGLERRSPWNILTLKYIGMGTVSIGVLLIGLMFLFQNAFRDEVRAGKEPVVPVEASSSDLPRQDIVGAHSEAGVQGEGKAQEQKGTGALPAASGLGTHGGVSVGEGGAGGSGGTRDTARPGKNDPSQSEQTIPASTSVSPESSLVPEETLLRLHGSNTIGAKLAPALVSAYLKTRLNATGITSEPGSKEDEQIIRAKINGRRVAVEIQAHGSSTAFQDLAAGTCDIGNASRKIKDKEVASLAFLGDMTSISSEHVIGLDGIAVLVNKSNGLKEISTKDLQAIFSGRTTDWQGVNGQKGLITVYARDNNSGTYDTFKSLILSESSPLVAGARRYESNSDLSDDVSRDPAGIGFTGLPYVRDAKALAVSEEGAQAIYPNFFTVATEDYPISRRLYMYTASVPKNPHVAPFINFVLSDKGQKVAQETGFVDMNIRTFFMDPVTSESKGSVHKVQNYLDAVKGAQRLSLNFRFKKNATALDNRSIHDLDRIIAFLADKLDKRIVLAGFADNSGDYEYNYKLAMARAQLVASELRARGIAVGETFSCGQEMPVATNTTEQGKEKNRRVEVWLK